MHLKALLLGKYIKKSLIIPQDLIRNHRTSNDRQHHILNRKGHKTQYYTYYTKN